MNGIISRNMKAVQAFIGGLITVTSLLLVITDHLPTPIAAGVGAVAAVLTTVQVWLAKNEPLIEEAETAVDDVVKDVVADVKGAPAATVTATVAAPKRRSRAKAPAAPAVDA